VNGPPVNIGPYRVRRELGRGGTSTVYLCHSSDHHLDVAVKVFHGTDAEDFQRFQRERQMLGTFGTQAGYVPLLDMGRTERGPYLVMPFVPGGTLRARLFAVGALEIEETAALGRRLAVSIGHAHAKSVVHRDLKPENILFTAKGDPLIADLGLAKHFKKTSPETITQPGDVLGTLGYMSPEQIMGQPVGAPADVFSLGAILYECLTSCPVFPSGSMAEVIDQIVAKRVQPILEIRPDVPPQLAAVVHKALAFAEAERYRDGYGFAVALGAQPGSGSYSLKPPR
jgi:serine/threonine-protein kinase